jgi:endonuclease YncB( thermonuclease family)
VKLLLVVVAITMTSAVAPCARSEQIQPSQIFIVSGDTIEVYRRRAAVTLVGFKAPETRPVRARCAAERKAGAKVAQRARDLVAAGGLDYEDRKCACPLGAQGTSRCNLGRGCGVLTVNGRDLGQVLIDENLAVPYLCAETSCPPPPNPWCAPLPPASGR